MTRHAHCLFHVVAKNKGKECIICVSGASDPTYSKGGNIIMFGLSGGKDFEAHIGVGDFYMLMFGQLNLPYKMRVKEILL